MGRIPGHYEWDDDDLTPGKKREGGLHQNLFDSDGNLKGSARFVPDDQESQTEPVHITETVYVHVEERRGTQLDESIQEIVRTVVDHLIDRGVEWARPRISEWWQETARPYAAAKRDNLRARRSRGKGQPTISTTGEETAELGSPLPEARRERPRMSEAEAKARLLAALAARAFGEEQLKLVTDADIVGGSDTAALEQSLAELPADQLQALVLAMATNPMLLSEDSLADLASIIGRSAHGELLPRTDDPDKPG